MHFAFHQNWLDHQSTQLDAQQFPVGKLKKKNQNSKICLSISGSGEYEHTYAIMFTLIS